MNGLSALLPQVAGAHVVGTLPAHMARVHTDTRSLQPGDLFVALRGDTFDAHEFLPQVARAGAVGAVVQSGCVAGGLAALGLPGIEVPDTRLALGDLARLWRMQFHLPLIAVTGSNGKTTVTQMIASILHAAAGDDALATRGNLNNDIGVPQTLLRLRPGHRLAVVELGMNHPGEIANLAAMTRPTVALVNNAQREHQEFMGTVHAVALENGQSIAALPADGVAVFPSDDAHTAVWCELAGARRVLTFSDVDATADVRADASWQGLAWQMDLQTPAGQARVRLGVAGRHNVRNALAACACALAAGVPLAAVAQGLEAFEPVKGRSRAFSLTTPAGSLTVVDDTYNANPDSVRAAIDVLAVLPAPRTLVLGDMGEVGDQALAFHTEVLLHAQAMGLQRVWCTGGHMAQACAALAGGAGAPTRQHFVRVEDLLAPVAAVAAQGGSVLVKGSRFMKMERVVEAMQSALNPATATALKPGDSDVH
jgi:UDP-N-acetylmuramoyl-tripeptide--D-alanyl-D-alanine ligase